MRKTVLVTGSSRGIGRAIALCFARGNYNIVLNCKESRDMMQELVAEIQLINPNVIGICADVSDYEQVQEMFLEAERAFGNVHILINNAGISYIGLFNEMGPGDWNEIMSVNTSSVFNCSHVAIPSMIRRKEGCIINISSIWGNMGASCEAIYSASKAAVNGFTKALAKELGPCGIRVNAIACGVIDTDMNLCLSEDEKNALKEQIPLGHLGSPHQIGELAFFLAEQCGFITGQIITVDGGMF